MAKEEKRQTGDPALHLSHDVALKIRLDVMEIQDGADLIDRFFKFASSVKGLFEKENISLPSSSSSHDRSSFDLILERIESDMHRDNIAKKSNDMRIFLLANEVHQAAVPFRKKLRDLF